MDSPIVEGWLFFLTMKYKYLAFAGRARPKILRLAFHFNPIVCKTTLEMHIVPGERIWHHWTLPLLLGCVLSQYECSGLGAAGVLSCANCTKWNFYLLGKAETSFAPVAAKWEGGKLKVWKYNCLSSVLWCLCWAFNFYSTRLVS